MLACVVGLLGAGTSAAQAATLSLGDVTVTEGTGVAVDANFEVTLSEPLPTTTSFNFQTFAGTATQPADFTGVAGVVTIPAGETSVRVPVAIVGDAIDEPTETFTATISGAVGATIVDNLGVGTIEDDDPEPTISVADTTVSGGSEGTGANRLMVFTISLSGVSGKTVTVGYRTQEGTAKAQIAQPFQPGDFEPKDGSLTFLPGTVSQQITVVVIGDSEDEVDETFELELVNPANATLGKARGTGLIPDDDGPQILIDDVSAPEGAAGTTTDVRLTVSLSAPSPQDVSVGYASARDTAGEDDFVAVPADSRVTIPAGETAATITATIRGDDLDEADETFRIVLAAPRGGSLGDAFGVVTILDDDPSPVLAVASPSVAEGTGTPGEITVPVTLSAASGRALAVTFATRDGTAVAGRDFLATSGTLTFQPGETRKDVVVTVAADNELEDDEQFAVDVVDPLTGATTTGLVTIVDDDLNAGNTPAASVNDASVLEGDTGTRTMSFTVTLDRPIARTVRLPYRTEDGTATAPADYEAASGTLVIAPGERSRQVQVTIRGDREAESNHDLRLVLRDPVNARLADAVGVGIIIDDDAGDQDIQVSPARRLSAAALACAGRRRCTGVRVAWRVAVPGTIAVRLDAVLPPVPAKAGTPARPARARVVRLAGRQVPTKAGRGALRLTMTGKDARRVLARLRRSGAKEVRVTVTFTNRRGAQQATTRRLELGA
jgi:hypothetical protein